MWNAWGTETWDPWEPGRRWRDRTRAQRAVVIGVGLVVWFALVLAYGLAQREEGVRSPASAARAQAARARAAPLPSPATTTAPPPTTTATVPVEQPAAAPLAAPATADVALPPPPARADPEPAREPPTPGPPTATSCDAVADDLGAVKPGEKVAFRLDPACPYRPGSVTIAVNGQPPQEADVDENGVIWIEVAE